MTTDTREPPNLPSADVLTRRGMPLSLLAVALAVAAILTAATAVAEPVGELKNAQSAVALGLYLLALLVSLRPGGRGVGLAEFRLASWLLAGAAVLYGFATLSLAGQVRSGQLEAVDPALVPRATAVLALGFTMFALGHRLHPQILVRPVLKVLDLGRTGLRTAPAGRLTIITAYAVGIIATVGQVVLLGGYAYLGGSDVQDTSQAAGYTQVLVILSYLRTYALFTFSARVALSGALADRICLALLLTAEIVLGLLSGTKESFVIALLAVLIPLVVLRKRRLPWIRIVAASAVFVFFVTPFVTSLREDVRSGGTRLSVEQSLRIGTASLLGGGDVGTGETEGGADGQVRTVASRLRLVDNQVVIMDRTPEPIPYRSITELAAAPFTGLVPRAVWPGKPIRLSGLDFYRRYYDGQGVSSSALTFQGSLFMFGGVGVVMAGMFVLGGALRAVDDARERLGPLRGGLIAAILFIPVVKQELDAPSLLAGIPIFVVTYYLVVLALFRRPVAGGPS